MIKLNEFVSLSEGKTNSGKFSMDWTKTFEGRKIPHKKQECLSCDNGKICSDCLIKPEMNCFNCEMERACGTCLDRVSQKNTYFTDINMLKKKPANNFHQTLPDYKSGYEPEQNTIDFESASEILMKECKVVVQRRYERIYNMIACKLYIKHEHIPEKKRNIQIWIQTS